MVYLICICQALSFHSVLGAVSFMLGCIIKSFIKIDEEAWSSDSVHSIYLILYVS